jgi:hypothetical protein
MDNITITEPAGKRARNASVNLTERMCEKRVTKRVKIYDRKCRVDRLSRHCVHRRIQCLQHGAALSNQLLRLQQSATATARLTG